MVGIGERENTVEEQKQVVTDTAKQLSADVKTAAPRSDLRHVWIAEGNFLMGKLYELVSRIIDTRNWSTVMRPQKKR